jgi:hypothetical protein
MGQLCQAKKRTGQTHVFDGHELLTGSRRAEKAPGWAARGYDFNLFWPTALMEKGLKS